MSLIYIGILASMHVLHCLRRRYRDFPADNSTLHYPSLERSAQVRFLASLGPYLLPLLFTLTWVFVLAQEFRASS